VSSGTLNLTQSNPKLQELASKPDQQFSSYGRFSRPKNMKIVISSRVKGPQNQTSSRVHLNVYFSY